MVYGILGTEAGPQQGQIPKATSFEGLPKECICWCREGEPWQPMPGKAKPPPPPPENEVPGPPELAETDTCVCRALEAMDDLPEGSIEVVRRSSAKKRLGD